MHSRVCTCLSLRRAPFSACTKGLYNLKRRLGFSRVGRIFFHGAEVDFCAFDCMPGEDFRGTIRRNLRRIQNSHVLYLYPHCVVHRWKFKTRGIDIHPPLPDGAV